MPETRAHGKKVLILILLACAIGACLFTLARVPASGDNPLIGKLLRVLTIGLCLAAWFQTQAMIGSRQLRDGAITDGMHILFSPLHQWLTLHTRAAHITLIISSAFIDLFGLFLIGWSILGPSMRPFLALLILFSFRQLSQALCALPIPPGMIWRNPGFPSLLVTYGTGTDFFFSGHTAIAVLGAMELARLSPTLGVVAGIIAAAEALVVLVLRAHYTMDILGALAAAVCALGFSDFLFSLAKATP